MSKKNTFLPSKKTKSAANPIILATYSQLLALEPRLVFDAAAAATADAVIELKNEHSEAPNENNENSPGEHAAFDGQGGQLEEGQNNIPSEQAEVENLLRSFGQLQNNPELSSNTSEDTGRSVLVEQKLITSGFSSEINEQGEEQLLITGIQVVNENEAEEAITVTLQVKHGELAITEPNDLLVSENNSSTLTLYGKAADINNLLSNSSISYQVAKDFANRDDLNNCDSWAMDKLTFKVSYADELVQSAEIDIYQANAHKQNLISSDLNSSTNSSNINSLDLNSLGMGLLSESPLINTAILPVDGWLGMEGSSIILNGIEVVDSNPNSPGDIAKMFEVSLSLEVGNGMLTIDTAHLGLLLTPNSSNALTLQGTRAQLNAALHNIKYTANSNVYDNYKNDGKAADRLNIAVTDLSSKDSSAQTLNLHVLNAQQMSGQNQQEPPAEKSSLLGAQALGIQALGAPMTPFGLPEWSDAPEINFTGGFFVDEDEVLPLGTKVTFDDSDSTDFKITISVEHGKLILSYVSDLEGNQYYWADDDPNSPDYHKIVTFAGDKDTCQNALNTLKYQGNKYWNGTDALTIKIEEGIDGDGYNSGDKAVIETQDIIVRPVANTPEFIDLPAAGQVGSTGVNNAVWEDTEDTLRFNYGTPEAPDWRPLVISDPDSSNPEFNDRYNLTLAVTEGTLSSSYGDHTFNGQSSISLSNLSLDEVNGILANIKFLGEQNFYGKANLTVTVQDLGNADTLIPPSSPSLSKSFEINVLAVNDAPELKPAEENDSANQLHVKETYPGDEDPTQPGVGEALTLEHFHTNYNGALPDSNGIIKLFDVDNNLSQLVVTITSNSTQGDLWREIGGKWVKLGLGSTFSLEDVHLGKVKYVHNPSLQVREDSAGSKFTGSTSDSFTFALNDGAGATNSIISNLVMHIVIEPVNQAPEVVVEQIPGLIERLDPSIVYNQTTGQNDTIYTIWGYEGEQGLPFAFNVKDVDQADNADFIIHISQLPDSSWGYFWYDDGQGGGYQKVTTATAISLDRMQHGFLRFSHSGDENKVGKMSFEVTVTDDGGGTSTLLDSKMDLAINFRSNNDDPEWHSSIGNIWNDLEHTITVDGSRVIAINNTVLKLQDPDSSDVNLTYTVNYNSSEGKLMYSLGGNNYRVYSPGDKVSQAEIDSGKVIWWFNHSGDKQADLTFKVRDGSLSATPAPSDKEQTPGGIAWPAPGGSPSNWEDVPTLTPHEGGIGKWVESAPNSGTYNWELTEFTLHLVATNIPDGGSTVITPVVDPYPHFEFIDGTDGVIGRETLNEGGMLQFSDEMFKAWFKNSTNGQDIPPKIWDDDTGSWVVNPDGNPAKLVYRVEGYTKHGWLLYSTDGINFSYLSQYASFSQQDIIDGHIYYRHNSTEVFSDAFSFSVSDGRLEAKNSTNGNIFTFKLDMAPVNDTPETKDGADVIVKEHDLSAYQNADHTTAGGRKEINTNNIVIWDVDGSKDKPGQNQFSTKNDLYIVITKLPEHGSLYYNGVEITQALSGAALSAIKAGGGYATWGSDPNMAGIIVIKATDLTPGSSKLVYEHDGTESFYDAFTYIVSDNKGVTLGMVKDPSDPLNLLPANAGKIHDGSSVNAFEQAVRIVVSPVNDKPEGVTKLDPSDPNFDTRNNVKVNESGTIALTPNNLKYIDRDGSPGAIQFIISELPSFGKLYLNNKLLGEGSVFTQEDINLGRVTYVHDGSEHHTDSFKFNVSDSIYTSGLHNSDLPDIIHIDITQQNLAPTITAPKELQVDSIVGGVIINTAVLDPDFGDFQTKPPATPGYPGDGIVPGHDLMTVTIDLAVGSIVATPPLDLGKVHIYFKDGSQGTRVGNTITLTGSYAQIRDLLSSVKVQSDPNGGTLPGTAYDPNGDIILKFTVHDGIWDPTANSNTGAWVNPNGGLAGDTVYFDDTSVHIFISPINNPPGITNTQGDMHMSVNEDCGWVTIKDDSGKAISIEDIDAFKRGGNSITLTVEHGVLTADYAQVDGKSGTIAGRGTKTMTITGTLPEINAILETLKYKPDADYNSVNNANVETPDLLKFVYKDNANSGELPAGLSNDDANSIYNTPYKYQTSSGKWGIAVNGELTILVKPANDAPTLQVPSEIFLKNDHPFSGTDDMGNNIHIEVDDIDASKGNYWVDEINVTLQVTSGGWLTLPGAMGSVTSSAEIDTGTAGQYTKITLTGTLNDINTVLAGMNYNRLSWNGDNIDYVKITVNDAIAPASNGSPEAGTALDSETKTIKIYCSDSNDPPVLNLPNWTIKEDDAASKIFTGAGAISLSDADSFDKQIYVSISVDLGTLDVEKSSLGFNFSGNPALQDKFAISNSGKTITFYASAAKINAALKEISYKAPANYNGEAKVTVYANDMGMWGDSGGQTYTPVPAGNPIGVSGLGLVTTQTSIIAVIPINDAPELNPALPQVNAKPNVDLSTATNNLVQEDSTASNDNTSLGAKTVGDLFGGSNVFNDSKDEQQKISNPSGSTANSLAGIVITKNDANSTTQGHWQYSANGTSWTDIPTNLSPTNALYLDAGTYVRFNPVGNFNGQPARLTLLLADNSTYDNTNNPSNPYLPATLTNGGASWSGYDFSDANKIGNTTRFSKDDLYLSTHIKAVNDAPVVKTGQETQTLAPVNEDSTAHTGNTVSAIFTPSFDDQADNMSGKSIAGGSGANGLAGVVITDNSASSGQGSWQYLDGSTWQDIPTNLTDSNGLYLSAATRIRFLPAPNWNGIPGDLTVHLVDNSSTATGNPNDNTPPSNFSTVNLGLTGIGGTTRYSSGTVTLKTSVSELNDAPVVVLGNTETLPGIQEDPAYSNTDSITPGTTVSNIFAGHFNDEKDNISGGSNPNNFAGVLVVSNTANPTTQGAWQYHNGTTWKDIPVLVDDEAFALKANWNLRFNPALDFNGEAPKLSVRFIDSSVNTANNPVATNPAPPYGVKQTFSAAAWAAINADNGITRYSKNSIALAISIAQVNDAPVASNKTDSIIEDTNYSGTVESLFAGSYSDAKDDKQNLGGSTASEASSFEGIFITGNSATSAQGKWQYLDGTWKDIPSSGLSDSNAFYLSKSTSIKFVPQPDYNGPVGQLNFRVMENYPGVASDYTSGNAGYNLSGKTGGAEHISGGSAATLTLTITGVNDAPVVNAPTPTVNLGAVDEDAANPGGQTLYALFGGYFDDSKDQIGTTSDPGTNANSFAGIMIIDYTRDTSKGEWQFKIGAGAWTSITDNTTLNNAIWIPGSTGTLLRFVPAPDYNGEAPQMKALLVESGTSYPGNTWTQDNISNITGGNNKISDKNNPITIKSNINAVNDAPQVLVGKESISYDTASEDSTTPTPKSVNELFGASFSDPKDANAPSTSGGDTFWGVAIVDDNSTSAQGAWQYSLDSGVTWINVKGTPGSPNSTTDGVSLNKALILDKNAQLRFLPAEDFNGKPGKLTVRLIDNHPTDGTYNTLPTSGEIGSKLNLSGTKTGGTTNYSDASNAVTLTTKVLAFNDAPTIEPGEDTQYLTVSEDHNGSATNRDTVLNIFNSAFNDNKDAVTTALSDGSQANNLAGVVVTGVDNSKGVWKYSTNGGTSWIEISDVSQSNGLVLRSDVLLSFFPKADYNNSSAIIGLTVRLVDDSGTATSIPATGDRVNVSGTVSDGRAGGITRYSLNEVNLKVNVTPVNDAPQKLGTTPVELPAISEDVILASNPGETLKNLFDKTGSSRFDDSKDNVTGGTSANNFQGILIVGYTEDASKGHWKYSTDAGSSWTIITDCTLNNALLLNNPNVRLHFEPALDYNGEPPSLSVRLVENGGANTWTQTLGTTCVLRGDFSAATATGGISAISNASNELTVKITVNPVNDAPTILSGKENVDVFINEGSTASTIKTITELFGASFSDAKDNQKALHGSGSSEPNDFIGVFVKSIDTAKGKWYYEATLNQNNWVEINLSGGAIFLSKDTRVKFVSTHENYNNQADGNDNRSSGAEKMVVHLVENGLNTYTKGDTLDLNIATNKGGATQVSNFDVTAHYTIKAINNAPVDNSPGSVITMTIEEDANSGSGYTGIKVYTILSSRFDDTADQIGSPGSVENAFAGIIVQSLTIDASKGQWQYWDSSGTPQWRAINAGMFLSETTLIRFEPKENWNATAPEASLPELKIFLVEKNNDGSLPYANKQNVGTNPSRGGSTKISHETTTLKIKVTPVNDAPVWNDTPFTNRPPHGGSQTPNDDSFLYYGNILAWQGLFIEKTVEEAIKGKSGTVSAFDDNTDNVIGGSSANNLKGVLITGIEQPMSNLGHWEYFDGSWKTLPNDISETNAFFLAANTKIHFIYSNDDIPVGTPPHSGLEIALVDNSGERGSDTWSTGSRVTTLQDHGERGATSAVSETSKLLWVTVTPKNAYPEIYGLANHTVNEREVARIAGTVVVSDANLDNSSSSNQWQNASITITRDGAANPHDTFEALGSLDTLAEGSNFKYNGTEYGKVEKNSNGVLTLKITRANTLASEVSDILRDIGYKNTSHDPANVVTLKWTIDDGNYVNNGTYPQGINKPGDSSGKSSYLQTITIVPINDAPVAINDHGTLNIEKGKTITGNLLINDFDVDNPRNQLSVCMVEVVYSDTYSSVFTGDPGSTPILLKYGTLNLKANGDYTYTLYDITDTSLGLDPEIINAIANLKQGQSLAEYKVLYQITDGGHKGNRGVDEKSSNKAVLNIEVMRPVPTPPPPPPTVEYVHQDTNKSKLDHIFEEKKEREKHKLQLKDMEVKKPVVANVNTAYTALRESLGDSVNNMKGHSPYKLSDPSEAFKRLNKLSIFDRSAIIITRQPDLVKFAVGEENQIKLPSSIFYCSDERERLKYTATMANGKPLPNWLLFNPTHLTFSGTPPEGETNILDLVVTARNSSGREASVNFSLNLNSNPVNGPEDQNLPNDEAVQPNAMPQTQGEQIRLNGEEIAAPGLSAQLDCNGQSGLLKAAQEFLRSIQML